LLKETFYTSWGYSIVKTIKNMKKYLFNCSAFIGFLQRQHLWLEVLSG
jgi:hypothetical protein